MEARKQQSCKQKASSLWDVTKAVGSLCRKADKHWLTQWFALSGISYTKYANYSAPSVSSPPVKSKLQHCLNSRGCKEDWKLPGTQSLAVWGRAANLLQEKVMYFIYMKLCLNKCSPAPLLLPCKARYSSTALVNQTSLCARQTRLTCSTHATSFQLLCPHLWTCGTWSHCLRHMKYPMHIHLPPSLPRDMVSKLSLKPRVPEGFNSIAPSQPLKNSFTGYESEGLQIRFSTKPSDGIYECGKKYQMGRGEHNNRENEKVHHWKSQKGKEIQTLRFFKTPYPKFLTIRIRAADFKLCSNLQTCGCRKGP